MSSDPKQPLPDGPIFDIDIDHLYDAVDDDEYEESALDEIMCGKYPGGGGGCDLAGTEWCDWDCPFSR